MVIHTSNYTNLVELQSLIFDQPDNCANLCWSSYLFSHSLNRLMWRSYTVQSSRSPYVWYSVSGGSVPTFIMLSDRGGAVVFPDGRLIEFRRSLSLFELKDPRIILPCEFTSLPLSPAWSRSGGWFGNIGIIDASDKEICCPLFGFYRQCLVALSVRWKQTTNSNFTLVIWDYWFCLRQTEGGIQCCCLGLTMDELKLFLLNPPIHACNST